MLLTLQPAIKHIKRNLITLLRPSNRHQPLIAIILRLINLNHAPTKLANLINLGSALANDCSNHIVRDIDLLRERLAGKESTHGVGSGLALCLGMRSRGHGLVRAGAAVGGGGGGGVGVVDWRLGSSGGGLAVEPGHAVGVGGRALGVVGVPAVGIGMAVGSGHGLRDVGNDLHAAGHDADGGAVAGGVGGGCGATETLCQLLDQSLGYVVGCDMDSIGNTIDGEAALAREREARVRSIDPRARSFLNLANAGSSTADDSADKDGRNKKTKIIRLGLGSRRLIERLLVEGADNQSESLASLAS